MSRDTERAGIGATFHIVTLGCKVNQYESHALREAWLSLGYRESAEPGPADVILINSCAITAKAVADVRAWIRKMHKASSEASIIVTGCAAQVMPGEFEGMPGVCEVVGQAGKAGLLKGPEQGAARTKQVLPGAGAGRYPVFEVAGYDRSRAVLKVQDGCSHGCAYCIVPQARGGSVSRPAPECVAELEKLLAAGFGEVVISGINLRQYQSGGHDFWDLMSAIEERLAPEYAGKSRLRLSSLEPGQLDERALDFFSRSRLAAPQLHISLQSGSSSVLSRMRRGHYSPDGLSAFFGRLRGIWPVFGLGADLIAGFPGETAAEHAETVALCRELPLTYAHVFPFSPRPGTLAARMPDQVESSVKKERSRELRELVQDKKNAFAREVAGLSEMRAVFESGDEAGARDGVKDAEGAIFGGLTGVNEYYVDCRLEQPTGSVGSRKLTRVRPVGVFGSMLIVTDKF